MHFAPTKCKVMLVDVQLLNTPLTVQGEVLEVVERFTYLGSCINSDCSVTDEFLLSRRREEAMIHLPIATPHSRSQEATFQCPSGSSLLSYVKWKPKTALRIVAIFWRRFAVDWHWFTEFSVFSTVYTSLGRDSPSDQIHGPSSISPVASGHPKEWTMNTGVSEEDGPTRSDYTQSSTSSLCEHPSGPTEHDPPVSTPHHHHHHSTGRDRSSFFSNTSSLPSSEKHGSNQSSISIHSKLAQLTKSGDLEALKLLVREGARNLPRLVAYLLKHGAHPDLAGPNGDTALHEASRMGHTRVIRALLRHNADPFVVNSHGLRPADLCQDHDSIVLLNQHIDMQRSLHSSSTGQTKSLTSTSSRVSRHGHHSHSSTDRVSSHGSRYSSSTLAAADLQGFIRSSSSTTTPDVCYSDSEDNASTSGLTQHTTSTVTGINDSSLVLPNTAVTPTVSPSVPVSKNLTSDSHLLPPKTLNKDPYAFEDDETEEPLEAGVSLHPPASSACGLTNKATSPTNRPRQLSSVTNPSSVIASPSTVIAALPEVTTPTSSLSFLSSETTTSLSTGSLRLRFAKEAGQYTLMEQQQQQQSNTTHLTAEVHNEPSGSVIGDTATQQEPRPESVPKEELNNVSSNLFPTTGVIPVVTIQSDAAAQHGAILVPDCFTDKRFPRTSRTNQVEQFGHVSSILCIFHFFDLSGPPSFSVPSFIDSNPDDAASLQKVPPLRIKFASGASTDSDSLGPPTSTSFETDAKTHGCFSSEPNVDKLDSGTDETPGEQSDSTLIPRSIDITGHSVEQPKAAAPSLSQPENASRELNESQQHMDSESNVDFHESTQRLSNEQPIEESLSDTARSSNEASSELTKESTKESHRHRSGRTLRSHTAAQREREERERHTDTTPIKKRKLRQRNENNGENGTQPQVAGRIFSVCTSSQPGSLPSAPIITDTTPIKKRKLRQRNENNGENGTQPQVAGRIFSVCTSSQPGSLPSAPIISSCVTGHPSTDCPNEPMGGGPVDSDSSVGVVCKLQSSNEGGEAVQKVEKRSPKPENFSNSDPSNMDTDIRERRPSEGDYKAKPTDSPPQSLPGCSTSQPPKTESPTATTSMELDGDISYLTCPLGPDDDKRDMSLHNFENPFEKAAAVQKKLRELINNLVEVHPKAPCAYQQYLLVSRNYLLAYEPPSLVKKTPPSNLPQVFVELFNQQEEERYAQALKHQSEREHLRLCAEQARLRAQTRAALANLSKPLSFCSAMAYKDLTYVPPVSKTEQRDEENVRDRFTQRMFIGWLENIRDTFQQEKKKLLCRQLHEAESLMMVQRLDWEIKLKETHVHDYSADIFRDIPASHVPLIHVPNDFPLFPHDPVPPGTSV
ncbi:hypothetical protein T265_07023 [Opisthorchis viverrini]|uniref:Uncharacterized protein n=1 Tax=Opisthorchis viverrini TaxID=6198 RepID=A0A075ACP9_OPIVI|nr:hypothetical protein T265_07023 [Opisthorchis viverrini]KER25564.1 hypothetical protein T265_07023 [Opisthorchis viverrini]